MASERQDRLRALVLAACEDLGRYGLEPTPEAVAAVASLVVNASRLGAEVDAAAEVARLTRELEESRRERSAARAEALTAQASLRRVDRELEEARERERAVRVAAHDYLAEVAGTLADMHDGEECRFEGGEGCLACYAQGRIGEMQDALAATPPDTESET